MGVLLTQLTNFAQEVGQMRAEITQLKGDYAGIVAKLQHMGDTCQRLELLVSTATSELKGRFSVEDRTDLRVDITAPNSQVVGVNNGKSEFTKGT